MDNSSSLESRITVMFPDLTSSHRKLARFVLDNSLFVAFASATEFGGQVGVSAATVVRFCQTLGYAGYPEFQLDVRAALPTYLHEVHRLERGNGKVNQDEVVSRVFDQDVQNLRETGKLVPQERFKSAVDAICRASDILVVGAGLSAAPALYFNHSLSVMGFDARVITAGGIPLAMELVRLKPTSILISISVWRYVAETVLAMDHAKNTGASRIAITDSLVSPIAQRADFAFQVSTHGTAHSLSLTSVMALIDAFNAAISSARPEETARALREVDAAYHQGKLLFTD